MRTPLNAIIGMSVIGKRARDIDGKDYALNKINDASLHLISIVNDILDMAKIEADRLELAPAEYNFQKMLQKVLSITGVKADEKRQKIIVSTDGNVPQFIVGDEYRLMQVIINLLSNAVKFSHDGGEIRLKVFLEKEIGDKCELRVEVVDNGIGIAAELHEKLFDAFEQVSGRLNREYSGTGLGLAIAKRIVGMMGGRIWVESKLGKGAKFTFTVFAERRTKQDGIFEEPEYDEAIVAVDGLFEGKRLLVAEDIDINYEILTIMLEDSGLIIERAKNGQEALDIIVAEPDKYDIVFMDLQMPKMGGLEATRLIRALHSGQKRLPIIAITANVFKDELEICSLAGMDGYLTKPFDFNNITEVLRKHLTF
jgi:CheY-like chemotaxis protein/two-component sensor histidine kinase